MKSRVIALTVGVCASLPATGMAEEVRADLGGVMAPVGPEGTTVVRVERALVAGARYAIVRSREAGAASRCGVPAERVSAWTQVDGRWVEALNEVFDRCPADRRPGIALVVRARVVQWSEGPTSATELHVRLLDPRLPANTAPTTRFRRVGDRFVNPRGEAPLAAAPGAPAGVLRAVTGAVDGRADEWQGVAPFAEVHGAGAQRAEVWLGAQGSTLRFAARIEGAEGAAPELTLRLAEPGISTARLRGTSGNAGRTLTLRCAGDGAAPSDAMVRCGRQGSAMFLEGETDLASMLWSRDEVDAVSALATVSWGDTRGTAEGAPRMRAMALPAAFTVLEGASAEAVAACAGGYRGRVSESAGIGAMPGMITCGTRCEGGLCERTLGSFGAATRMIWEPTQGTRGLCMNVTGVGAEAFAACRGEGADHVRLLGQIPARGFDLVVAVERTLGADGAHRPEVWTLVTRSARWHRIWSGEAAAASAPRIVRVGIEGQHPTLCREGNEGHRCERVMALSFMPAGDLGATALLTPRARGSR
ncbi:MAG: hypothetical protein U0325_04585 [Polyangiales bacterium]